MSVPEQAEFTFLPLGAIIQEFRVGGKNIVLGFPTQKHYVEHNTPHYGATIGRVANRIKDGRIANLNGREYQLVQNDGPNALHGGPKGWGKRIFEGPQTVTHNGRDALLFKYRSVDAEEGYPGTVEIRVWYAASKEDEKTVLTADYEVELIGDECEETVVNITNHSYFNIGDGPTITGTTAQLATSDYLPLITKPFELNATGPHFDDVFVVQPDPLKIPLDTRSQPLRLLGRFSSASSGLHLEVHSTEPAFQFYTGKYINVPSLDGAPPHTEGAGFCVEPSRFVNAINEPKWRDMVLLKKGQVFGCTNVYKAWKE
ncbi:Glycoside hydrolase-type carbohydrate-binding subgroup [Penicillium chermesinum]|nr:Glycoside hydrolase-type carbohydrate-binding subgroup [Penicillium chermesinum]